MLSSLVDASDSVTMAQKYLDSSAPQEHNGNLLFCRASPLKCADPVAGIIQSQLPAVQRGLNCCQPGLRSFLCGCCVLRCFGGAQQFVHLSTATAGHTTVNLYTSYTLRQSFKLVAITSCSMRQAWLLQLQLPAPSF